MTTNFQKLIATLTAATIEGSGETSPELRKAVTDYAVSVNHEQTPENGRFAPELIPYINKVALHAYKITDSDVEQLKSHNYSEDEIFELTVTAALGAGLARLESGLNLLTNEGGDHALTNS